MAPWGHGKQIFKDLEERVFPEVDEVNAVRRGLNGTIICRVHMKDHKRTQKSALKKQLRTNVTYKSQVDDQAKNKILSHGEFESDSGCR